MKPTGEAEQSAALFPPSWFSLVSYGNEVLRGNVHADLGDLLWTMGQKNTFLGKQSGPSYNFIIYI